LMPQTERILHIELALKFYLGVKDDWIGPNRRDLLSRKLTHTFNHQLPLAQTSAAGSALRNAGLSTDSGPVISAAVMRGCLFHPAHDAPCAPLPERIAADHWSGFWCPADQLDLLPEGQWYVLSKPDWISPVVSDFAISAAELRYYLAVYFRYLRTPVCIANMAADQAGHWYETERWMIVPGDWENDQSP
ncbi:MAG: DUF1853 family protein, partial [Thalassolituus sp.]